jgi:hypothetical protein
MHLGKWIGSNPGSTQHLSYMKEKTLLQLKLLRTAPFFAYKCTLIKKKIKFSSYMYKEIQNGAVAKSYMTNGLLIYGEIFTHFLIY